jgi:hypothetical protein
MASISGAEKDGGLNPRLHTPLIILAVIALMIAALSLGVVAFVVITSHPEYQPAVGIATSTAATRISTIHVVTTTTRQATTMKSAETTTTINAGGPVTTFIEYTGNPPTTTTLPAVPDEQSCNNSYHGQFNSCGSTSWTDYMIFAH